MACVNCNKKQNIIQLSEQITLFTLDGEFVPTILNTEHIVEDMFYPHMGVTTTLNTFIFKVKNYKKLNEFIASNVSKILVEGEMIESKFSFINLENDMFKLRIEK